MHRIIKAVGSFAGSHLASCRSENGVAADPAATPYTAETIQRLGFKDDNGLHRIKLNDGRWSRLACCGELLGTAATCR